VLAAIELARERAPAAAIFFAGGDARLPPLPLDRPVRLLLATVTDRADVAVGRGENAGSTLAYHRIVRSLDDLGPWDGSARDLPLPAQRPDSDAIILFAQDPDTGSVVALGQRPPS
jgi:hypothetical protein